MPNSSVVIADNEQQTPVESTPVEDVEMGGAAEAEVGAGGEETALASTEVDEPKIVPFSE